MGFNSGFKGLRWLPTTSEFLYVFFWVIPRRLNSDGGELPRITQKKAYNIQNTTKV